MLSAKSAIGSALNSRLEELDLQLKTASQSNESTKSKIAVLTEFIDGADEDVDTHAHRVLLRLTESTHKRELDLVQSLEAERTNLASLLRGDDVLPIHSDSNAVYDNYNVRRSDILTLQKFVKESADDPQKEPTSATSNQDAGVAEVEESTTSSQQSSSVESAEIATKNNDEVSSAGSGSYTSRSSSSSCSSGYFVDLDDAPKRPSLVPKLNLHFVQEEEQEIPVVPRHRPIVEDVPAAPPAAQRTASVANLHHPHARVPINTMATSPSIGVLRPGLSHAPRVSLAPTTTTTIPSPYGTANPQHPSAGQQPMRSPYRVANRVPSQSPKRVLAATPPSIRSAPVVQQRVPWQPQQQPQAQLPQFRPQSQQQQPFGQPIRIQSGQGNMMPRMMPIQHSPSMQNMHRMPPRMAPPHMQQIPQPMQFMSGGRLMTMPTAAPPRVA